MRCENPSWESKCVLEREEAEMGVMVILANPTGPMLSEAASAGFVRKSAPPRSFGRPTPNMQRLRIPA